MDFKPSYGIDDKDTKVDLIVFQVVQANLIMKL